MCENETNEYPPAGWTCFHCGETFNTVGGAIDHFGAKPDAVPGCIVKVTLGPERGLLEALRSAESRLVPYMEEDTVLHRELYQQQLAHSDALRTAEEAGYARGLRDNIRAKREMLKQEVDSLYKRGGDT